MEHSKMTGTYPNTALWVLETEEEAEGDKKHVNGFSTSELPVSVIATRIRKRWNSRRPVICINIYRKVVDMQ
jgi:hypothetical protein